MTTKDQAPTSDQSGPLAAAAARPVQGVVSIVQPATKVDQVAPVAPSVRPSVRPARFRRRHYAILFSFIVMVLLPIGLSGWYLWNRAVDQYESRIGFAVRAEGQSFAPDLLSGILGPASSSTTEDMHILTEFILSQEIVSRIDAKLDLKERFSGFPEDPVFALAKDGTIEDLVSYWGRMVVVDYSTTTGLMELTVFAFSPQDAQEIAAAVLEESSTVINTLSAIAREDSTRFARDALEVARTRASDGRAAIAQFRAVNKVADPSADIASQMGVVASLQQQLAESLVELDLLRAAASETDPRIAPLERRIEVIEGRIAQERAGLGIGSEGAGFAELLGEYERLTIEQSFAEQAYLAALAGFDAISSSAAQNSRYLATFVPPTLAEASTAPVRPLILLLVGLITFLSWASIVLIYYALRDRH